MNHKSRNLRDGWKMPTPSSYRDVWSVENRARDGYHHAAGYEHDPEPNREAGRKLIVLAVLLAVAAAVMVAMWGMR